MKFSDLEWYEWPTGSHWRISQILLYEGKTVAVFHNVTHGYYDLTYMHYAGHAAQPRVQYDGREWNTARGDNGEVDAYAELDLIELCAAVLLKCEPFTQVGKEETINGHE